MWFTFIFTSCQGFPPPLKLFIILTTPLLYSASINDLSLPLSLQSRLAVKAEYKTEEQFSYFKYHWKTDLSCFRGPIPCLLPPPKLPFAVERCSTSFLFVIFSSCVLQGKPLRWFVSQAHETLLPTVKCLILCLFFAFSPYPS